MSNFISVHDTHRLPYNNATITAKKAQSGDTTPIKFFAGADDEELGYEVYTNARGYICDRSGELYTKGVFVKEDAIVTATLGNGASTSWLVRSESDITVNDGKLLGKIVDDRSQWEQGREYVLYGGHYHLVLHSANTPDNRPLPLEELDGVPAFNEWKEVEQVKAISSNNLNVKVEQYTKTLVLQWAGNAPTNRNPIYVVISTEVLNNTHRYAQHCLVYNQTPYRLTLKNATTGATIGNVAPNGTLNMGLFFLIDMNTGEWIEDDRYGDWDNGFDASANGNYVEITGTPNGSGYYEVAISDRTPNVLLVRAKDLNFTGMSPKPDEIKVKLVGQNLTKARHLTLWFQNACTGDGESLPAVFYMTDTPLELCILYPATLCDVYVGAGNFTVNNAPMLLDNCDRASCIGVNYATKGSTTLTVPRKCDYVNITNSGNGGISILKFHTSDLHTVRVNVNNTGSQPLWFQLMNTSDGAVQHWAVCPAGEQCNFTVRNSAGLIYALSPTECYPTRMTYSDTAIFDCDYDIRGLATTLVMDCSQINRKFNTSIGDHNDHCSDVTANIQKVVPDGGQQVKIGVKFGFFMTSADEDGVRMWVGSVYSNSSNNIKFASAEEMTAEDEGRYYLNPGVGDIMVSRVGNVFTNHGVTWR